MVYEAPTHEHDHHLRKQHEGVFTHIPAQPPQQVVEILQRGLLLLKH